METGVWREGAQERFLPTPQVSLEQKPQPSRHLGEGCPRQREWQRQRPRGEVLPAVGLRKAERPACLEQSLQGLKR
jgi:hypothetical protein